MMHLNNNNKRTQTPASPFSSYGTQWGSNPRYNKTPSKKVVSIPVHFVGSERNRTGSATKIQKVTRGFLVRKNMKKMLKLKVELEEIEKKVNDDETVKKMKKEQKERIRISETIMNLLLRLDSVRVFQCCYALRDLRKLLIKRAIFLQEFVDQIQMVGSTDEIEEEHVGGEKIEALVNGGSCVGEEVNCVEKEKVGCEEEIVGGVKIDALVNEEKNMDVGGEGTCVGEEVNFLEEEGGCEEHEGGEKMESLMNEEKNEDGGEGKCVKEEENCLMEEEGQDEDMEVEEKEESVGTSFVEEGIEVDSVDVKEEEGRIVIGCEEGDDENRKMLKRMMEDNEKMMNMMAKLFEKNEKQTSLLTSLTQRVEQLERAFTCDKLRKMKKRRNVDAKHRYYNGCI